MFSLIWQKKHFDIGSLRSYDFFVFCFFQGILNSRDHRNEMSVRLIMDYVHFCRYDLAYYTQTTTFTRQKTGLMVRLLSSTQCTDE